MDKKSYIRDGRAPKPTSASVSRVMSANKGKDTKLELEIRNALKDAGVSEFKTHPANIPGRPDIVYPNKKLAVFVNGCFWHHCPKCKRTLPKSNRIFWKKKFERNQERDKRKTRELRRLGWKVITIWECDVRKKSSSVVRKIEKGFSSLPSRAPSRVSR